MAKTYKEKLLDPRWQRRRLDILNRADFKCEIEGCWCSDETLHVHHLDYISGNEPWEYPDEYLMAVCASCHEMISQERPGYEKIIISNYRLKLKDHFIQKCAADVFQKYKDLHQLIYLLWECNEQDVVNVLILLSNKELPAEILKPIENAEPNT
ncbi:MAG TPA: HNH endonuclease signature motif containing protein [Niastella sp.]